MSVLNHQSGEIAMDGRWVNFKHIWYIFVFDKLLFTNEQSVFCSDTRKALSIYCTVLYTCAGVRANKI